MLNEEDTEVNKSICFLGIYSLVAGNRLEIITYINIQVEG